LSRVKSFFCRNGPNKTIPSLLIAVGIISLLALPLFHNESTVRTVKAAPLNLTRLQTKLLSGFASFELLSNEDSESGSSSGPSNYFPTSQNGCSVSIQGNIKVNQNCLNLSDADLQGRGQAQNEPSVAANPNNPSQIIAGYNDYRRGDATCGTSYSLNGGSTWQDSTVPNGFTRFSDLSAGFAREYWEGSGDTAVAWDTRGNAYLECMVFERGTPVTGNPDSSSAIYVLRSTQNFGASFNFPAHPVVTTYLPVPSTSFLDKPYMAIDDNVASIFRDRIYVTWTYFASDGSAKIYEAHSSDYGQTFSCAIVSAPTTCTLVSTPNPLLCPVSFGIPGSCNENQFSQPFVGPDGALYVVFANFNNAVVPPDNHNQILLAKSTDGGVSFGPLVKVSDYYDLPDCFTYQGKDFGRACLPEKGSSTNSFFRATNYPVGGVNPQNSAQVVVSIGSYINAFSKETNGCVPADINPTTGNNLFTGVKTPGACNNKILLSVSSNGGATFTGTTTDPRLLATVNQAPGQATTDQWWQWAAFTNGGHLTVSYYDRSYGNDETTGSMDVSISGSNSLSSFQVARVTSSSLPVPTQFSGTFLGDYAGLTIGENAQPVWADTRNKDLFLCPGTGIPGVPPALCTGTASNAPLANDQDIFTSSVAIPGCKESDGNGAFKGNNGDGNFNLDSDQCEDGISNSVSSSNLGDGKDFKSTQILAATFDAVAHTVTITGLGTHGGAPVAFTFVALETSTTTPGWVSFTLSDGYTNAGTLTSGSIILH
jgi:hypothetical protein